MSTPVDGVDVLGALSPSRAGDFMTCPLLYRFRTIDRLPEPSSPDAVRGTVVHKVLEDLFDLPAPSAPPTQAARAARAGLGRAARGRAGAWRRCSPATGPEVGAWLASCREVAGPLLHPGGPDAGSSRPSASSTSRRCSSPSCCCAASSTASTSPPTAQIRVVDYKTGRSPGAAFEAKALFQMKFYALVIWRTRGVVPAMLQLVYLGNGEMLRYVPDEADLLATERKVEAIWRAIRRAEETGDWRPSPSRLCDWCAHQALCPAFGGTPPPLPAAAPARPGRRLDTDEGVAGLP